MKTRVADIKRAAREFARGAAPILARAAEALNRLGGDCQRHAIWANTDPPEVRFTSFYSGDDTKEVFIALGGTGPIDAELARKLGAPPDRMWAVEHVMLVDDGHKRIDFGLVLHSLISAARAANQARADSSGDGGGAVWRRDMSTTNAKTAPLPPWGWGRQRGVTTGRGWRPVGFQRSHAVIMT